MIGLAEGELTYQKTVAYLQEKEGFDFIASETGLDTVREDLFVNEPEVNPIDTLYLSVL